MRITQEKAYRNTFVAEYDDLGDMGRAMVNRRSPNPVDKRWAGRTPEEVMHYCAHGHVEAVPRAERMVAKLANVAITNLGMDLGYNAVHGVLDYSAMMSGDPMCMYGTTITETDKAPVGVYIDSWISCVIPNSYIERRGAAVLALVLALSIYRPVVCKYISAAGATFDRSNDNIQIVPVPTHPMDISRAAFMLSDPGFTRAGIYQMTQTVHGMDGFDSGPMMGNGNGRHWQATQLGKWAAKRDGAEEVVFLPMMVDKAESRFASDDEALVWVQKQLERFIK